MRDVKGLTCNNPLCVRVSKRDVKEPVVDANLRSPRYRDAMTAPSANRTWVRPSQRRVTGRRKSRSEARSRSEESPRKSRSRALTSLKYKYDDSMLPP